MPDGQIEIDVTFIERNEGGVILKGYVPAAATTKSGVTIGMGLDLGQRNQDDLDRMSIPQALKSRLSPYLGMQGEDAAQFLAANPLTITAADAAALDSAAINPTIEAIKTSYDATNPPALFADLPAPTQTAIVDLAYQYGTNLPKATPHFWSQITTGAWPAAISNLRNFGDAYPSRRNREADLIQQAISA